MRKLVVILVIVLGIINFGFSQSYYIKHDHICRGSSYEWIIYNATPNDTIIYRSRTIINGTFNWTYDTIIGNSITLFPNDSTNRFEIISINNDPNVCKERLQIDLYGYTGNNIPVSNNTITLPDVEFVKIINSANQQVYACYTAAANTTVSGIPSGAYDLFIIDNTMYSCPVTIPITVP